MKKLEVLHHLRPAEPGILFPAFCGSAERIGRDEGRAGEKLSRDKKVRLF